MATSERVPFHREKDMVENLLGWARRLMTLGDAMIDIGAKNGPPITDLAEYGAIIEEYSNAIYTALEKSDFQMLEKALKAYKKGN